MNEIDIRPPACLVVNDLKPHHGIRVFCYECRHVGIIKSGDLRAAYCKYHERIADLEPRFKCRRCNTKGGRVFWETVSLR